MKIHPKHEKQTSTKNPLPRKADRATHSFLQSLQQLSTEELLQEHQNTPLSEKNFRDMAGIITQLGELLSEKPTVEHFQNYKKHLRSFLSLAQDSLEVRESLVRVGIARTKLLKTIEQVDQTLMTLAEEVLQGESHRLRILDLTQSIQGLLIDLLS